MKKYFTNKSIQLLNEYNWPGNIRELRNIVERAVIVSIGNEIKPDDLHLFQSPSSIASDQAAKSAPASTPAPKNTETELKLPVDLNEFLNNLEYKYVLKAYETYGSVRAAAKALHISPSKIVRIRQRHENIQF